MKTTVKIISLSIAIFCLVIYFTLLWMGFFKKLEIKEMPIGGYVLAGTEFVGDYSKCYPAMAKVDSDLRAMGIISTKGFGIYYDNPDSTPKEKCRSLVGNVIEITDSSKLAEIINKGLKIETVTVKQAMVIEFAIKNDFSYMVGPIKAYPVFNEYIKAKKYKPTLAIEIYDVAKEKILYIMQYEK